MSVDFQKLHTLIFQNYNFKHTLTSLTENMKAPVFINDLDKTSFAPFTLIDCRKTQWPGVRLSFSDWDWFEEKYKTNEINNYYLNGYGIQGLVIAARISAGLKAYPNGLDPNSEGDTCYLIFDDLETAVKTATLASEMINDLDKITRLIAVARQNGLEE